METDNSDIVIEDTVQEEETSSFETENNDLEAEKSLFLQDMEQLLDEHDYALPSVGDIRTGIIVSISGQGVIVDLGLKRDGIVPTSDLDKLPPQERDSLQVNDEIDVYIQSTDQPDSLVVSRHMALLNQDWIRAQELFDSGEIFEGEIIGYNRGGALVGFGGLRGFIPASHLTALGSKMNDKQRQQNLARLRGELVPLKVIEIDRRRRRLVLSEREATKVWKEKKRRELMASLSAGDVLTGRVSGWKDFGAFVDLGGVDGLIHVSELAWYRVKHPRQVLNMGEELEVYVLKVDRERDRISLSRKKLLSNPWSEVNENYSENQLVEGRIIRIVDYGAFVELEPGIEGLLHISQLSRGQVGHPREVVKEGETHLLRIISIDQKRERIGLSLKAVRSYEQIEWMTQKELEAQEAAAKAEAAAQAKAAAEAEAQEAKAEPVAEKEQTAEAEAPAEAETAAEAEAVETEPVAEDVEVEEAPEEAEAVEEPTAEAEVKVAEPVAEDVEVKEAPEEAEAVEEPTAEAEVEVSEPVAEDVEAEAVEEPAAEAEVEVAEPVAEEVEAEAVEEPTAEAEIEVAEPVAEDVEAEEAPEAEDAPAEVAVEADTAVAEAAEDSKVDIEPEEAADPPAGEAHSDEEPSTGPDNQA